jgi:hypothetical protein
MSANTTRLNKSKATEGGSGARFCFFGRMYCHWALRPQAERDIDQILAYDPSRYGGKRL